METLLISFLIILFSILGFLLTKTLKNPKSISSNPLSYPLIGSLLSFNKNRHRLLHWYTDLLRLSPSQTIAVKLLGRRRFIVTANQENVEYILKTNFVNFPKGKPFTDLLGDLLGAGIFNADGELWRSQRKLASHEFTMRSLKEFTFEILKEEIENRLFPVLESVVDSRNVTPVLESVVDSRNVIENRLSPVLESAVKNRLSTVLESAVDSRNELENRLSPDLESVVDSRNVVKNMLSPVLESAEDSRNVIENRLSPVLESAEESRNVIENRLSPVLESPEDSRNVIDLQEVLKRFAFDVICKVSLGWDPDCLDLTRPVPDLVKAFDIAAEISARRATEPVNAIWKLKRLLNVGSERRLREAIKTVHVSVSEIINAKKKSLGIDDVCNKQDLLSRFLAVDGNDEDTVRDIVISFIMAGRDTTSAAMTWLFWALSENADVEEKILEEVSNKGSLLGLGFEDLREMNYTKACLCETMRLYPPVAWDSKHAVNDDVLPDGTRVKKGDKVTYFPYGMGRMEKLWGKDCEEFKPNRWFEENGIETKPVLKNVSSFKFPVFQAGPRICIGKEMAFMQMKYVVGSVLKRFEIVPVSDNRPVFVPLLTAHMVGGLKVKVKRRNQI